MKFTYQVDGKTIAVELVKSADGFRVVLNGQMYPVRILRAEDGELSFSIGDAPQTAYYARDGARRWVFVDGRTFVLTSATPGTGKRRKSDQIQSGENAIRAPMPGHVRVVQVAEGDMAAKGQALFVLEAMKMEIRIPSPRSGRVTRLLVQAGQAVEREQVLAEIE